MSPFRPLLSYPSVFYSHFHPSLCILLNVLSRVFFTGLTLIKTLISVSGIPSCQAGCRDTHCAEHDALLCSLSVLVLLFPGFECGSTGQHVSMEFWHECEFPGFSASCELLTCSRQFIQQEFEECQTLSPVVESKSSNASALGVPPYYMLAFELGGVPTTTMVGSDPSKLSWQVRHKRGKPFSSRHAQSPVLTTIGRRLESDAVHDRLERQHRRDPATAVQCHR